MTDKFQNKYRISSARAPFWDYGCTAAYFVTICTQDRKCYFGDVVDGKMNLSGIGIIADVLWHEIKNHTQNVELEQFVVMPNHIHGILIINNDNDDGTTYDDGITHSVVETTHALSLPHTLSLPPPQQQSPPQQTIGQKRFQHQGKNTLSSIIGSYKSAVTKHAHRLGFDFAWQSRFHDHIIRNEQSFQTIADYIANNPLKWENDKFNQMNKNIES